MKQLMLLLPSFLLAFLCGVFIASLDTPPLWFAVLLATTTTALLIGYLIIRHRKIPMIIFICLGLLIGIERYALWDKSEVDSYLEVHVGQRVTLEGVVTDEPDVREGKTLLTVTLARELNGDSAQPVFGTALIIVNRFPEYHYGDRLHLQGKLALPEKLTEKDGRVFDYPSYLRSKGVRYQMVFPLTAVLGSHGGNIVIEELFRAKAGFEYALGVALPSPHSALLSGLLLGGKQSLGAVWLDRFRTTGIVHIIVLSGYNMTVVAEWLVVLFQSLGFYGSLSMGSLGIILFALMTGGGATVMRAAIMALIVLLSKATGRSYDMGRALLVAATLMVLQNPSILLFDPSFQLSFLASVGLIFVSPVIEKHMQFMKNFGMWKEICVSTLATQVVVLPLLLYQTGMLSLIALPANLLVLPLIPLTMFTGFIAGVVALLTPTLGFILGLPAYGLLSWILGVAEYGSNIPYAAVHTGNMPAVFVFVLYVFIAFVVRYEEYIPKILTRFSQAQKAPPLN